MKLILGKNFNNLSEYQLKWRIFFDISFSFNNALLFILFKTLLLFIPDFGLSILSLFFYFFVVDLLSLFRPFTTSYTFGLDNCLGFFTFIFLT
jgi:hypothetical protein